VSLIEEALRKQREEVEKDEKSVVTPPPAIPLETPPEPTGDEAPTRRPWAMLAGLVLLGILGVAFILWLLIFGLHLWQTKPAPATTPTVVAIATNTAPAPTPPVPPKVAPAVVPATNASAVAATVAPATNVVASPLPRPANQAPAVEAIPAPKVVDPRPTESAKQPQAVTNEPIASPAKVSMPAQWPKLLVTGIIGSRRNGHSAAIVNGQMLSPGDSLEGVKIEAIEKQRVKLAFQGEEKFLSVGGSTE